MTISVAGDQTSKRRLVAIALLSLLAAATGLVISSPLWANSETAIVVHARGDVGGEQVRIIADGTVLDTVTLTRQLQSFQTVAAEHPANVRVEFFNDGPANGGDRNAVVQFINVAGVEYRTNDPSVLSTGTYQSGNGCEPGNRRSIRLHCNGYFEYRIDVPANTTAPVNYGQTRIEVRAQGTTGEERIDLRIGNRSVANWTLTTSSESYTVEVDSVVAGTNVDVRFTNDGRSDQGDRNVRVDFVAINGRKIEAEDPSVFSQGSHTRATGCSGGHKSSEVLHCNGFFRFEIPNPAPAATPGSPESNNPSSPGPQAAPASPTPAEPTPEIAPTTTIAPEQTTTSSTTTTTAAPVEEPENDIAIFARGNTGEERIELRIDGKTVSRFDLTRGLAQYRWSTDQKIGSRSLAVHFVNDARSSQGDRNVTLDRLVVNGTQFQTEAASTEILGSWTNGSCKQTGNHQDEVLTCNGYARYNIGSAGQFEGGTPSASPAQPVTVNGFPKAGHNDQVGCVGECRWVGFQDFDGADGATLENVIITNPGGPCLSIRDASNITIRNVTLRNCATDTRTNNDAIVDITNSSNVTITGSLLTNNASTSITNFDLIHIENSSQVTIRNNEIRDVHSNTSGGRADTGNRAILVTGDRTRNLTIEHNSFYNPGRNALQITRARNLTGISVTNNRIEGRGRWTSEFEDMINFYSSGGTSASPIIVRDNYLRNGGPSASGTAIILGDGEGNQPSEHITVERNVIVDPGHVGINVAGGNDFIVRDNIIYGGSDVGLWTSTGLTINHYRYTPECRDHEITGNRVYFRNQHSQHNGTNHIWNPRTCTQNVNFSNNNIGDRSLSYDVWDLDG